MGTQQIFTGTTQKRPTKIISGVDRVNDFEELHLPAPLYKCFVTSFRMHSQASTTESRAILAESDGADGVDGAVTTQTDMSQSRRQYERIERFALSQLMMMGLRRHAPNGCGG